MTFPHSFLKTYTPPIDFPSDFSISDDESDAEDGTISKGDGPSAPATQNPEAPSVLHFRSNSTDDFLRKRILSGVEESQRSSSKGSEIQAEERPFHEPSGPRNYVGFQQQDLIKATDWVRKAAKTMIVNGRCDVSRIPELMTLLENENALIPEHRMYLTRILTDIQEGRNAVAKNINSIEAVGEDAAEVVRETLNLPLHARIDVAHMREAFLVAYLGYLRQDYSAVSCFATGPTICLMESNPDKFENALMSLLKKDKLVYSIHGEDHEVPLNKSLNQEEFDYTLPFSSEVYSRGIIKLHEIPVIEAAMNALGIPKEEHESACRNILRSLWKGEKAISGLTGRKIVELLVEEKCKEGVFKQDDKERVVNSAINAGVGRRCPRLLLCLQNTLASASEIRNEDSDNFWSRMAEALWEDQSIPGRSDLHSLAHMCAGFCAELSKDKEIQINMTQLGAELIDKLKSVMNERLRIRWDANRERDEEREDGNEDAVSSMRVAAGYKGLHVLHILSTGENLEEGKSIKSPCEFREALKTLLEEAARCLQNARGSSCQNGDDFLKALNLLLQKLKEHCDTPEFIDYFDKALNPHFDDQDTEDLSTEKFVPWNFASGGHFGSIASLYGGEVRNSGWPPKADSAGSSGRALFFAEFLYNQCVGMNVPDHVKVPASDDEHTMAIVPARFQGGGSGSFLEWKEKSLRAPALAKFNEPHDKLPLKEIFDDIARDCRAHAKGIRAVRDRLMHDHEGKKSYTVADIYQELKKDCDMDDAGVRTDIEEALKKRFPSISPVCRIGDSNYIGSGPGVKHFGISHDVFSDRTVFRMCTLDGKDIGPYRKSAFRKAWFISTPFK